MTGECVFQAPSAAHVDERQLSAQELSITRQLMEVTGVTNLGVIMQALRLLGSMPPQVVHTLGQMDPKEIQLIINERAKTHGFDASQLMGLMGVGGHQQVSPARGLPPWDRPARASAFNRLGPPPPQPGEPMNMQREQLIREEQQRINMQREWQAKRRAPHDFSRTDGPFKRRR